MRIRSATRLSLFAATVFFAVVFFIKAPAQAGEADAALLAAACSGCHAKDVREGGFPQIYGRPAGEVREAMLEFKADTREGTVMNRIAKGYSEEEIGVLADYLSAQSPSD